jgi:hypothetical protein
MHKLTEEMREERTKALFLAWQSPDYENRVNKLCEEGLTHSDATAVVDAEITMDFYRDKELI